MNNNNDVNPAPCAGQDPAAYLQHQNQQRRKFDMTQPTPMLVDPVRAQLLHMFDLLDQRGRDSVMSCAANNLRYPKG